MKKTLLIAAAALAAGIISSQAQPVYSQNIVGYVNKPVPSGYVAISNPLDNPTGNSLTNLIPGIITGQYDNSYIYVWVGTTYSTYFCDSSQGGLNDSGDNGNVASPILNPGTTVFINNAQASNNIVFAGTVHADGVGASTNVIGVTTNTYTGEVFIASKLPVSGGIHTALGLPTSSGALDQSYIYVPSIDSSGVLHGFTTYYVDSGVGGTGIADSGDNFEVVPEPTIPVGGGFFINTPGTFSWVQSL
jgi:hypothetical protein